MNIQPENFIAGPSKTLKVEPKNLDETKTSLKQEIMSDLAKMFAENQIEMLKLIAPKSKKEPIHPNNNDSDSESENISVARTSTPIKTNATSSKTTPNNSRNTLMLS